MLRESIGGKSSGKSSFETHCAGQSLSSASSLFTTGSGVSIAISKSALEKEKRMLRESIGGKSSGKSSFETPAPRQQSLSSGSSLFTTGSGAALQSASLRLKGRADAARVYRW